jgi:streptomycin 6-kinase
MQIVAPAVFAEATIHREGESGIRWINALPKLVDRLLNQWRCAPDGAVGHGGVALIVPVRTEAGEAAVMKVSFAHPGNIHEPFALEAWNGKGAIRLLHRDDANYAMLLERAGATSLASLGETDPVMRVAGELSRQLAIPAPAPCPPLVGQLSDWHQDIERGSVDLPGLFDNEVIAHALATLSSGDDGAGVLIHGDLHAGNILQSERAGWLAIDPKGYAGDRAFDAGIVVKWMVVRMLQGVSEHDLSDRAVDRALAVYAEAAEVDRDRARAWAQVHALQGAFWSRRHGIRRARSGDPRDRVVAFADHLATTLAVPSR